MPVNPRLVWGIVAFVSFFVCNRDASAGWWHRHCTCAGSSSGFSAAPLAAAPAAAQPAATNGATTYYYYAVPVAAAPAPSQGLLPIDWLSLLRCGLGSVVGTGTGTGTIPDGSSASAVSAALTRIETSHADLRGQMINNAGISQSIGERVVAVSNALERLDSPSGPIMQKLDEINRNVLARPGGGGPSGAAPAAAPSGGFEAAPLPGTRRAFAPQAVAPFVRAAGAPAPGSAESSLEALTKKVDGMDAMVKELHADLQQRRRPPEPQLEGKAVEKGKAAPAPETKAK